MNGIALCQGNCVQGNGTETDNKNYQDCLQQCINAGLSTTAAATAKPTATVAGGNLFSIQDPRISDFLTLNLGATATGGTATSAGAVATTTSKAGAAMATGASMMGAVGILVAIVAL